VAIGANKSKFSSAVTSQGRISVAGGVKAGLPFLTRIGSFDVDLAIEVGAGPLV
jgi:D-3-phosphoglycerate dehydrogenase